MSDSTAPNPHHQYSGDIPVLSELADLIGSLDLDTPHKVKYRETDERITAELNQVNASNAKDFLYLDPNLPSQGRDKDSTLGRREDSYMHEISSISLAQGADSTVFTNMRSMLQSVAPFGGERHVINDQDEHTVVRYGTQCSFRSRVVSGSQCLKSVEWPLMTALYFRGALCAACQ